MKTLTKIFGVALILVFLANHLVLSGQNSGAGIRFDFNASATGNQNLTHIACPGANNFVRVDIYVTGASNLDTYEFNINYNSSQLQFMGGAEDNPVTYEANFLKTNGGSTTGFTCTASGGMVNCANTLVGNNPAQAPEGEGLLASIVFKALVNCPGNLSFGDVYWYDNDGDKDVCTNKGADASLPVQLSLFEAEAGDRQVLLKWTTQSEVDNLGFNIHRSLTDTSGYKRINGIMIKGAGNSSTAREYSYEDKDVQNGLTYYYKLEQVDLQGNSTFYRPVFATPQAGLLPPTPTEYALHPNYPNPFNPSTRIRYDVPKATYVKLEIYNTLGQRVRTLVNENKMPGSYQVVWDGRNGAGARMHSGIYFYVLSTPDYQQRRKMLLIR